MAKRKRHKESTKKKIGLALRKAKKKARKLELKGAASLGYLKGRYDAAREK